MTFFTMVNMEDLVGLEQMIRDLEDFHEGLPMLIFILKIRLIQAKRAAGITGPILPRARAGAGHLSHQDEDDKDPSPPLF